MPAAINPVSSSIQLSAIADAGLGVVQNNRSVGQTTTVDPLSASVSAQAWNGDISVTAETAMAAAWTTGSSGQVTLWNRFSSADLQAYPSSELGTCSPGWFYSFTSDAPAIFTLNYTETYSGLYPYVMLPILQELVNGELVQQRVCTVPSSGSFAFTIDPGQTYTVQLWDLSNCYQLTPFVCEMNGTYSFEITAIPEPGLCWVLAIAATIYLCGGRWRGSDEAQVR